MIQQTISNTALEESSQTPTATSQRLVPSYPPFSQYSTSLSNADLFNLPKERKKIAPKPIETLVTSEDLIKDIKVMGIMLTDHPKVLIQYKNSPETLMLSIGEKINDLILKDIQKDKIIFDHQGDSIQVNI